MTKSRAQVAIEECRPMPVLMSTRFWRLAPMAWVPTVRFAATGGGGRTSTRPVRVVICDDSQVVLSSLDRLLSRHEGIEVVGLVGSFEDLAVWMVGDGADADVVLLDVRLPGESGVSGLKEMRRQGDATPVVLMSAYPEHASAAARAGAAGFFHKAGGNSAALAELILGAAGRPPRGQPRDS